MTKAFAALVALSLMFAIQPADAGEDSQSFQPATICQINEHLSSFLGKRVLLKVHYVTDSAYATYITDEKHGRPKCLLEIQTVALMKDPSVKAFFKAGRELCDATKRVLVCNLDAEMEVEAIIKRLENGTPYADFQKIIHYRYY